MLKPVFIFFILLAVSYNSFSQANKDSLLIETNISIALWQMEGDAHKAPELQQNQEETVYLKVGDLTNYCTLQLSLIDPKGREFTPGLTVENGVVIFQYKASRAGKHKLLVSSECPENFFVKNYYGNIMPMGGSRPIGEEHFEVAPAN